MWTCALRMCVSLYWRHWRLVTPNPNFMPTLPVHRKITNKRIKNLMQVRCTICELPENGLVPLLPWSRHLSSAQNPIQSRASYNTANYAPSFADCFHKLVLPSGSRGKQSVNDRHSCLHLNVQRRTVAHVYWNKRLFKHLTTSESVKRTASGLFKWAEDLAVSRLRPPVLLNGSMRSSGLEQGPRSFDLLGNTKAHNLEK
jgi:hypothetical protein